MGSAMIFYNFEYTSTVITPASMNLSNKAPNTNPNGDALPLLEYNNLISSHT